VVERVVYFGWIMNGVHELDTHRQEHKCKVHCHIE